MMNRRDLEPVDIRLAGVPAVVKWYNPAKGFGFVQLNDGSPDAFLHVSVVERTGRAELPEGTTLVCDICDGRKGPQVASIVSIGQLGEARAPRRAATGFAQGREAGGARDGAGGTVDGTVKFFNLEKGFGFVSPDDGGKDVYVSVRLLQRLGVASLEPRQRVRLTTRMGQKGPMADRVELI